MSTPSILARVKKSDETRRPTGDGSDIRTFSHITTQASQRQISLGRGAALFATNNVIHMKGKIRVFLMNQTVFTDSVRPLDDETAQSRGNDHTHAAVKLLRERALAKLMTWSS